MERKFVNEQFVGTSEPDYNRKGKRGAFKVGCLVIGYANPVVCIYPRYYGINEYMRLEVRVPLFV